MVHLIQDVGLGSEVSCSKDWTLADPIGMRMMILVSLARLS